jgi:hypothetical protein
MNLITEQVILGSMCGDGNICHKSKNPVFREVHSIKQEDYLLWKSKLISELNPRVFYSESKSQQDKFYKTVGFYTSASEDLIKYQRLFYYDKRGEKHISYKILKMLKPLALAIWYLDDGSYNYSHSSIEIASCMNNLKVLKSIKRYFIKHLGLECNIHHVRDDLNVIRFTVKSSDKFLKLIQKYVPDSMRYKLGHLCEENLSKIKEFKAKAFETSKLWKKENAEYLDEYFKNYRLKNKDSINAWHRQHYIDNKDAIQVKHREYNVKNKDKISVRGKIYRLENREMIAAKGKIRREKNKKYEHERHRIYYMKNRVKILARQKERKLQFKNG